MAAKYGQRPSLLLGLPSSLSPYACFCFDEALFLLEARYDAHRRGVREWERERERGRGEGDAEVGSLYDSVMNDPRTGRPPTQEELAGLIKRADRGD